MSQNLKKFACLSKRKDSGDSENENPRKGMQGGMRKYGGGRSSMKEEKIETTTLKQHENRIEQQQLTKNIINMRVRKVGHNGSSGKIKR